MKRYLLHVYDLALTLPVYALLCPISWFSQFIMIESSHRTSGTTARYTESPPFTMVRDIEKVDGVAPAPAQPSGPLRPPDDNDAERRFQPRSLKFWSVMISIFLALFLVALDRTIIGTATPEITQEFHSLGDIGWYGSAYQLTTAASQLLFGRVYKFYEIKRYVPMTPSRPQLVYMTLNHLLGPF